MAAGDEGLRDDHVVGGRVAAESRAVVANNVHVVQQLAFDGLQDQNVALLQVCALVVSSLALGQLL